MSRHVEEDRLWKWFHLLHNLRFRQGTLKKRFFIYSIILSY